jgi:hypothetical protein
MPKYMATPHTAAGAVVDLAPATGLKTVLQVGIPAAVFMDVLGWGISIAGTVAADVPFYAYLMETDVAATVGTSLTPDNWDTPQGQASLCVGGAAATSYSAAYTEGTIAASRFFDNQRVHPQTGYSVWFPSDARPECGLVSSARFLRLRINAVTAAYNLIPWICWEE